MLLLQVGRAWAQWLGSGFLLNKIPSLSPTGLKIRQKPNRPENWALLSYEIKFDKFEQIFKPIIRAWLLKASSNILNFKSPKKTELEGTKGRKIQALATTSCYITG
jgi:hypothetical protein